MESPLEKTVWFSITSDYYNGPLIEISNSDNPEEEGDSEFTFEVPKDGYRMYVVHEYPEYEIVWQKDLKNIKECKILYLDLLNQIHSRGFSTIDSKYKKDRKFLYSPEEIEAMENLACEIRDDSADAIYFVFAIDKEGNEVLTELLRPIES